MDASVRLPSVVNGPAEGSSSVGCWRSPGRAGDVYHWPAGHTATSDEGAVFVEVGPVAPMRQFHDHAQSVFA